MVVLFVHWFEQDMERYRSGHNEAVLKTVCPKGRVGSNPTLSAVDTETFEYVLHIDRIICLFYSEKYPSWPKGHPWKGCRSLTAARGFKSLLLRFIWKYELFNFFLKKLLTLVLKRDNINELSLETKVRQQATDLKSCKKIKKVVDKSGSKWYSKQAVAENGGQQKAHW